MDLYVDVLGLTWKRTLKTWASKVKDFVGERELGKRDKLLDLSRAVSRLCKVSFRPCLT